MSIQNELDKIKNAVYGVEVRGAIHDGIKKAYDDASKNGNANMEVEMARGAHKTLSQRFSLIESLADGSPQGVYPKLIDLNSAFPIGNKNIYVVSEDGKWYFWDDNKWKPGGIYQAAGIDETFAEETVKLLSVPIIENIINNGNFINLENWSQTSAFGRPAELSVSKNILSVRATTGVGSGVRTDQSLFVKGRKYYVRVTARVTNEDCNIMQLKQGDVDVFDTIISPEMNKWYMMEGLLTITSDTHDFLHIMHQYSSSAISSGKEMQVEKVIVIDVDESFGIGNNLKVWDISEKVDNIPNQFFNGKYSLFKADNLLIRLEEIEREKGKDAISISEKDSKDVFEDKTAIHNTNIDYTTGNANPNVYFATTVFTPAQSETDYVVDRNDFLYSNTGNIAFYDAGKKYISGIQSTYEKFRTPVGCSFFRFSVYYNDVSSQQFDFKNMRVQKGTVLKPSDELASFTNIRPLSPLKNKKVVFLGDSLTEKNNRSSLNYHDYIKQELDITTFNMGVGGTGYKNRDNENKAFYHRALNVPLDADAIIIFGFINDALFMDIEIGNATDKTIATWCGCVNRTIDNLESKFLYVPLGIITPPPCDWVNVGESSFTSQRPDDLTCRVSLMTEKMSEICKLRGIPLLDLFHQSNLRPWIPAVRKELFSCGDSPEGDGLHLNSKGHKKIYRRVMKFTEGVLS